MCISGRTKQSSVPATRGTAAAYAPAAPRVPVADCGRWRGERRHAERTRRRILGAVKLARPHAVMTIRWILVWTGWGLFMCSLALPAVQLDWGAWNNSDENFLWGIACAMYCPYFYASNVLMLLSPIIAKLLHRKALNGWPRHIVATVVMLSCLGALAFLPAFRAIHVGYVLWVVSFLCISISIWMIRIRAPTMPSSVPLPRGTPPARQESRLGSRSAHG